MRVCPGCRATYDDTVGFCQDDGLPLMEVSQTFARPAVSQDGPTLPPVVLEAGMMVGEYRIERHIATGGMGAIYAGIHPVISKRVAIKVLDRRLAHDPRTLSRFVLEARSVNQIGHHNIVDIFSIGELDDGRAYLIMELLDGLPLHQLISRAGRLHPGHILPLYQQLCDALRAAHAKGFVHRDLKPDNIVVLRRPPHPFIKILDFGIAKLRHGDAGDDEATAVGTVLGTPEYMAPEQCRGDEIDHRVDIYALGVMLYELVCGRKPFSDPNPMRVLAAQLRLEPTPPSQLVELPEGLEALILKAMAKRRDDRFASVAELIAALQVITTIEPWTLDLSPFSEVLEATPTQAPRSGSDTPKPTEEVLQASRPRFEVKVPAPLMISGEHSFDLDELSRLAPDEEEQTVTAIVDPEHAAARPGETSSPARSKGRRKTGDRGRRPSLFPHTPALTPESLPLPPDESLIEPSTNSEVIHFISPDAAVIGQTAIEEEVILAPTSSSELVIEHSLQDQMEQARSMQQQAVVRRVEERGDDDRAKRDD